MWLLLETRNNFERSSPTEVERAGIDDLKKKKKKKKGKKKWEETNPVIFAAVQIYANL